MRTRTVCLVAAFALLLPRLAQAQSGTQAPATQPASQGDIPATASQPTLGRSHPRQRPRGQRQPGGKTARAASLSPAAGRRVAGHGFGR